MGRASKGGGGDVFRSAIEAILGERHAQCTGGTVPPMRPIPPATFWLAVAIWALAAALCFFRAGQGAADPSDVDGLEGGNYTIELCEDAKQGDFGKSAEALVRLRDGGSVRVLLSYEGDVLYFARERIEATARFVAFSDASASRYGLEGVVCRAEASDVRMAADQGLLAPLVSARRWAARQFDGVPGMGSALLRALLIGDRSMLDEGGLYDAMKTVGLAHLVAVSGSHLAVVGSFIAAAMMKARVPRKARVLALCAFYGAYSVFTGLSAPVIRAAVMAGVAVCCAFSARRSSPLAALSVCVCVLIALEPHNAVSVSFFLSAASTLGVVAFAGLFSSWFSAMTGGRLASVCEAFGMTLAANVPIFPVTASVFARIPLTSPISNLIAAPAFSLLLLGGLGSLAVAALFPSAGVMLLEAMCVLSLVFCQIFMALAHIPYSVVPCSIDIVAAAIVTSAVVGALWAIWPMPRAGVARVLAGVVGSVWLVSALAFPKIAPDEIVMLDVGQGDAILVRSRGAALLVDTGNQDAKLMSALARQGVVSLDGVVVTHHDDDHCGSLAVLDAFVSRSAIYVSAPTFSCDCDGCGALIAEAERIAGAGGVVPVEAGCRFTVGRFVCTAVWPERFESEGGNADSLCLLVEYDAQGDGEIDGSALLTGDAEAAQLEEMLAQGAVGGVDIVKAGHHGSKNGVSKEAIDGLSPRIALISVGEGNRYGHPSSEAIEAFESAGARVFRTDLMGDVACRFSESGIEVFVQGE